jgi:hypothetical protein
MTEAAAKALANLRNTSHFEWYLIPFLLIIIYDGLVKSQNSTFHII